MDRLARNLDNLRLIVQKLTKCGVRIEFVKENLTFTGEDSQCLSRVKHSRCGSKSREGQMCIDMIPHCMTTVTRSYGVTAARLKSGVLESATTPTRSSND